MIRRRAALLVLLLAALQIAANLSWLSQDEGIQYTDAAFHYSQVTERHQALWEGVEVLQEQSRNDERQRYGSLYYLVATAVSVATGPRAGALLGGLSVLLWPLLLLGAYRLGFELAGPEQRQQTGLLSAALAGLLPGLFNYSRVLVLDLPLTITVCWSIALMLRAMRSEEAMLRKRLWLWAGLALLLGLAIKVNALAFLIGPMWVAGRLSLRTLWREDRIVLVKRAAAALATCALLAAWLLLGSRSEAILTTIRDSTWPGKLLGYASEGTLLSYPGHYLDALRSHSWEVVYYSTLQSFSPAWLLVSLAAAAWFFARKRGCHNPQARAQRDLVFWALSIPIFGVLFILRDIYDERYLLPVLPTCAALISVTVFDISRPVVRRGMVAILLLGGALNFSVISFDALPALRPLACVTVPGWAPQSRVGAELWLCALYPEYSFMDRSSVPARSSDKGVLAGSHGDRALEQLENLLQPTRSELGRPLEAIFLDDLYGLFYRTFDKALEESPAGRNSAALLRQQDMLLVSKCTDRAWLTSMFGSLDEIEETISTADVVIMRYGSPTGGTDTALRGRRCLVFWTQERYWGQLGSVDLEDGTSLRIYLRLAN